LPKEVIRATEEEKQYQITMLAELHKAMPTKLPKTLEKVQQAAINNENIFEHLMEATKYCS
jgi:methylmalonyl-CoA mutase